MGALHIGMVVLETEIAVGDGTGPAHEGLAVDHNEILPGKGLLTVTGSHR